MTGMRVSLCARLCLPETRIMNLPSWCWQTWLTVEWTWVMLRLTSQPFSHDTQTTGWHLLDLLRWNVALRSWMTSSPSWRQRLPCPPDTQDFLIVQVLSYFIFRSLNDSFLVWIYVICLVLISKKEYPVLIICSYELLLVNSLFSMTSFMVFKFVYLVYVKWNYSLRIIYRCRSVELWFVGDFQSLDLFTNWNIQRFMNPQGCTLKFKNKP